MPSWSAPSDVIGTHRKASDLAALHCSESVFRFTRFEGCNWGRLRAGSLTRLLCHLVVCVQVWEEGPAFWELGVRLRSIASAREGVL